MTATADAEMLLKTMLAEVVLKTRQVTPLHGILLTCPTSEAKGWWLLTSAIARSILLIQEDSSLHCSMCCDLNVPRKT
jgi:hypothetical protein